MASLVPTLHALLEQALTHVDAGRLGLARKQLEELVVAAQDKHDRQTEIVARAQLARILLRTHDLPGARNQLERAQQLAEPSFSASYAQFQAAWARLAIEEGPPDHTAKALQAYLTWAEDDAAHQEVVDAALLLADSSDGIHRLHWLERAIDHALSHEVHKPLGTAYNTLGAALGVQGELEASLEAYQASLRWHKEQGWPRDQVAAGWACGSVCAATEDWPSARAYLEEALALAGKQDDCDDLQALALHDLASVYEAAGDQIEARRLMIRARRLAQEQDLGSLWPSRYQAMVEHAKRLEV